jgi:hypothetical protein
MTMNKSSRINRVIKFLIPLFTAALLFFPTGITASQDPEQDTYQVYLPLVTLTPQDIYSQLLNSLGGSDNLFYVDGQLAFIGRGHRLVIVDVSAPNNPMYLTEIQLPAVPTYLTVQDGYGYLALGNGGFAILDLMQPAQAYLLSRLPLAGFSRHVLISENIAFVSSDQALYVLDISQPVYPNLLSSTPTPAYYSLFHDSLLLVVYNEGFTFFDISNLSALIKVGNYDNWDTAGILAVGADQIYMKGFSCGMLGCAEWIDIINISDPSQPLFIDTFYLFNSDPTIVIDGDIAYISDGANIIVAKINPDGSLEKLRDYPADTWGGILRLENDKLYLGASDSFEILDVSDPLDIEQVGKYTSSSYAFGSTQINLPFIYYRSSLIGAEDDALSLLTLDVSDPEEPELISETPFSSLNIQTGFTALQIYLDGNRLYGTYPTGEYSVFFPIVGIKILDLQQPAFPIEVAEYLPGGVGVWFENIRNSVQIKDAIGYFMTGRNLEIVDLSNPAAPLVLNSFPTNAKTVSIDGRYAYLIPEVDEDPNTSLHLLTLDVANPAHPTVQSDYEITTTLNAGYSFDVSDGIAYLGLPGVLRLIDVSTPAAPTDLSAMPIDSEFYPYIIDVDGDLALFGIENRLEIIDVSTPITTTRLAVFDVGGIIHTIQILHHYVYLASDAGAYVLDINRPDQPRVLLHYPGFASSIQSKPFYPVYIARYADGLEIYKPYPPASILK